MVKVSDEQLFYLMSRGINQNEATNMIVRELSSRSHSSCRWRTAAELNRLIQFAMEGRSAKRPRSETGARNF